GERKPSRKPAGIIPRPDPRSRRDLLRGRYAGPPPPAGVCAVSVPPQASSLQCDHGLRRQVIVESLLKEIAHGSLRPGHNLISEVLARRCGVSNTPIREAVIALAGVGVVDLLPNRGAIVRRVTAGDIREICQVRRALECEAVRSACGRLDRE